MLNLSAKNICLNSSVNNKDEAIKLVAAGLVANGHVAEGYETGMLARETQTSTFLGNGIAIPHGTLDTRHLVKETGVQIYQFPQGIEWGEGNKAYVVIGIAAKSDEHLALLRQLTGVLSDEAAAELLANTQDMDEFISVLSGKKTLPSLTETLISLNIDSPSLVTLSAINAAKLQESGYVNQAFVSEVISSQPLNLGNDIYLADSAKGNQSNGVAVARNTSGQTVITVAATDNSLQSQLTYLLNSDIRSRFATASAAQIVALFNGENIANSVQNPTASEQPASGQVIGTFTVRNDNGLHARPSAVLVQTLKPFAAKVTVENLDRGTAPANAKSTMKVVALGASQAHRLRFVAEGEDAQQAIEALAKAFVEGLGESVSFVPAIEDTIEGAAQPQAVESAKNSANSTASEPAVEGQVEGTFVIQNEHGLHARPSAVLVNEVKKYNATIVVQNLDRNTQLVSAKSLMKIVALGVVKGHCLRFVATGDDAQKAIDGIGAAIAAGLGE
ncbi:fused PTS fructose transporter subunit IIA/HPr protein [Actinobacillus genomosp. 1]|uniref:fused PTS fructose transporter subunit IIA/HPr protein n=1 Tax=Actinobacillus genomosp. 1 TaxID=254839 RepID=UPI002443274D|nr:fused PTS fructose transporter subunit IIA/HPr protein [Actinobacillus genomosp. 1]WGE91725.1 fused PTS fructose transporter subunit IIA/HPr protein [Actinobacillus genomosp. 1]